MVNALGWWCDSSMRILPALPPVIGPQVYEHHIYEHHRASVSPRFAGGGDAVAFSPQQILLTGEDNTWMVPVQQVYDTTLPVYKYLPDSPSRHFVRTLRNALQATPKLLQQEIAEAGYRILIANSFRSFPEGWRSVEQKKKVAGRCSSKSKLIMIPRRVMGGSRLFRNAETSLYHEMGHALAFTRKAHNPEWPAFWQGFLKSYAQDLKTLNTRQMNNHYVPDGKWGNDDIEQPAQEVFAELSAIYLHCNTPGDFDSRPGILASSAYAEFVRAFPNTTAYMAPLMAAFDLRPLKA